jgi:hypothetical protein
METFRLLFLMTLWTAIWAAPLPKLSPLSFQWVLDVTVAIGIVWFASIANISCRWRLATL